MSWGRKALSGRPGPSFHAWRRICRAAKRGRAALGALTRRGALATHLAEWKSLIQQKRQAQNRVLSYVTEATGSTQDVQ